MYNAPNFPFYIPSKGRHEYMITSNVLSALGVSHNIIVEPQEVPFYKKSIDKMGLLANIIELDFSYKEKYETCDSLGLSRSTGPGPARNLAWEHSVNCGYKYHWVMDDNIRSFRRLNKNERIKVSTGAIFRAMEDFIMRYRNVAMAGPNYNMFIPDYQKTPPYITNTRIYSCNLIRNDIPFRWRGRYNEDTILSLDMLKAGWCTVQFNAFIQEKMPTQTIKGGNTQEFYHKEGKKIEGEKYAIGGTDAKSIMLRNVHPDVSRIVYKFNRTHHHVNYKIFKQKLVKRKDINVDPSVNNYGMNLKYSRHENG